MISRLCDEDHALIPAAVLTAAGLLKYMDFKNKLILAPMAGFTDSSMRRILADYGCDLAVTEMISAKAMCYGDRKTAALARITKGEPPTSVQLFGHEPEVVAEAAVMIAEGSFEGCSFYTKPVSIDINMGCPMKKIVSSGDGSALMREPALAAQIVKKTARALEKYNMPLTVKIRAGWDKNSVNASELAPLLAEAGAACIAVHGRTREQMYAPSSDLSVIKAVRDAVDKSVPVIGNGDITCAEDTVEMMEKTGCDSVMIGRTALGNFWIFSEIKAHLSGVPFTPPTAEDRINAALLLIRSVVEEKGEAVGVCEARGRAAHLIKGLKGAAAARDRINRATSYKEIETILTDGFLT